jgi:hypothetical protein
MSTSGRPSGVGRGSFSAGRSSEVERIIAAADVDTTFAGKKARYRGRRSVRTATARCRVVVQQSSGF